MVLEIIVKVNNLWREWNPENEIGIIKPNVVKQTNGNQDH